jgi:hypothetical protein
MPELLKGDAFVAQLSARGDALDELCQRLVRAAPALQRPLLDKLHGRASSWPAPTAAKASSLREIARMWTACCVDIRKFASALTEQQPGGDTAASYEAYLRRVVLARVDLEPTLSPAAAACSSAANRVDITDAHVARLQADGFVQLQMPCDGRLRSEFELLHRHGVISPSYSSCNPGAHGVNLRCGTEHERAQFTRQGTPALLEAIETLRSLPHALLSRGYRCAARVANKHRSLELSARGPPSARSSPGPLRASDSPGQRWDVPTQVRARYAARAGHGARLGPPAGCKSRLLRLRTAPQPPPSTG